MPGHALVSYLQLASLVGSALISLKLFSTSLYRRYRIFFVYSIFRVANGLWPLFVDLKSDAYAYFWAFAEPLNLILWVWVVLELCKLVLEKHRGLYTLGRWAMAVGMIISVTLSILSLLPRIKPAASQKSRYLTYFYGADRGVTLCLAIFLILMILLISRYPVRLSRNVVLHVSLYTIFFLTNTLSVLLWTVFGKRVYGTVTTSMMITSCCCVLAWLLFLNPGGEEVRVNIPHFGPESEERILFHLDSLNTTLLKVARK